MPVGFAHDALLYAGDSDFLAQTAQFIAAGVASGEPTLVVVGGQKINALRAVLGSTADLVLFADMDDVGLNPARIIPAWRTFVDEHAAAASVRGIGEPIWADRSADELIECQRHESLLNVAFAGAEAFRLLCPYDVTALPEDVLEEAQRSHPHLLVDGQRHESEAFRGLADPLTPFEVALTPAPKYANTVLLSTDRLAKVRQYVEHEAAALGMGDDRRHDLMLAVTEMSVNSLTHGRGAPTLTVWTHLDVLICEVADTGEFAAPVLVGREQPPADAEGGRGLWLANQLCDLVQVRRLPGGTVVRIHQRA